MFKPSHVIFDEFLKPIPVYVVYEFQVSENGDDLVVVSDGKRRLVVRFYELVDIDCYEEICCKVCNEVTLCVAIFLAVVLMYLLFN